MRRSCLWVNVVARCGGGMRLYVGWLAKVWVFFLSRGDDSVYVA